MASITLYDCPVMEGFMKIAIAGAGAVGCHYGSKLVQAGFGVIFLARGKHLAAMQADGLKHKSEGQCKQINITATSDVTRIESCQVVILSCKMIGLKDMLDSLQHHISPSALLLTLQNGVEAPEMVAQAFPEHAVSAATAFIGTRLTQPGYVIHSAAGGIRMGLWQQGHGEQYFSLLINAFQHADVSTRQDNDPEAMLWRKLLWNCGFNAITAITRCYASAVAANSETLAIVCQAMAETVAVANMKGIAIGEQDIKKHIEVTLAMGPVKTSMWQDIDAGRNTEVDYINGYVVREAAALKIPTPVNRLLVSLIHAIEP